MKKIEDILFIVQARLESERVPRKMVKPFAGTTLLDILIDKIKKSKIIPVNNFYLSVCDEELISIAKNHNINYYQRSKKSALSENDIPLIFEWHDQLPYKYVVLISACSPLLSIDTIDKFVKSYINSTEGGMFGVVSKKQYFWDCNFKDGVWKGEDIFFCDLAREAGFKVYANISSTLTHHGSFGYKGKYEDKFKMKKKNGTKN